MVLDLLGTHSLLEPHIQSYHSHLACPVHYNLSLFSHRGSQKDYRKDVSSDMKVICWFVHNNGEGLIDGVHTDYIVPNLS